MNRAANEKPSGVGEPAQATAGPPNKSCHEHETRRVHRGRAGAWKAALFGVACLAVYLANFRVIATGDTMPARYLPLAIWRDQSLFLDSFRDLVLFREERQYWVRTTPDGHLASAYPLITPLSVTPLYGPAALCLSSANWRPDRVAPIALVQEKLSAGLLSATAAALFFHLALARLSPQRALILSVAFAFGTSTWSISSQALWQHGLGELLLVTGMLVLGGERNRLRSVSLGGLAALLMANRPPDILCGLGLLVAALVWARQRWTHVAVGLVTAALVLAALSMQAHGSVTSYAGGSADHWLRWLRVPSLAEAIGLFLSPGKGLLMFSPFLVVLPLSVFAVFREPTKPALHWWMLGGGCLSQILLLSITDYRGGFCYGPRLLASLLPALGLALVPWLQKASRPRLVAFASLVALSVAIHTIGAFFYDGRSSAALLAAKVQKGDRRDMSALWRLDLYPPYVELKHGPAPLELLPVIRGVFPLSKTCHP